jgi:ankyrin repeat protein
LEEIGKQNWEYAHRLFQCVAAASRPLRVEELAEFLAFDFDTNSTPTLREDWREEDPAHAVRSTCSSLLAIVDVDGSSVIQFAHFSVKEYLISKRLLESKDTISRFYISMTLAHTIIARACLGVLLHIGKSITKDDLEHFPLAKYAAERWVDHARFHDVLPNIRDGMIRLFDPNNHHLSVWVWIYDPELRAGASGSERPSKARATSLHYAASCGLHDIVHFLIDECSQDVNAQDLTLNETPLSVASRRGHSEVARVLLEHGAKTDTRGNTNCSPLDLASENGHVEVVRVLLENRADVNYADQDEWTALHLASISGEAEVARVLLEHGADADARQRDNQTPLYWAINDGVAQVLLEYSADPNAQDSSNQTPLHGVMKYGRAGAAQVLLKNGVKVNARDARNRTPLHVASEEGLLQGVRLLLRHGADIHARDNEGQTPLQVASASASAPAFPGKHEDVMQLLREYGVEDHRMQYLQMKSPGGCVGPRI